jgi:hypothetical protein
LRWFEYGPGALVAFLVELFDETAELSPALRTALLFIDFGFDLFDPVHEIEVDFVDFLALLVAEFQLLVHAFGEAFCPLIGRGRLASPLLGQGFGGE